MWVSFVEGLLWPIRPQSHRQMNGKTTAESGGEGGGGQAAEGRGGEGGSGLRWDG